MTTLGDLFLIIVFPQLSYRKGGSPAIGLRGRSNRDSYSFRPTSRGGDRFTGKCHRCGFFGHKMEFCRLPQATSFNSANSNSNTGSGSGSGAGGSKNN